MKFYIFEIQNNSIMKKMETETFERELTRGFSFSDDIDWHLIVILYRPKTTVLIVVIIESTNQSHAGCVTRAHTDHS